MRAAFGNLAMLELGKGASDFLAACQWNVCYTGREVSTALQWAS